MGLLLSSSYSMDRIKWITWQTGTCHYKYCVHQCNPAGGEWFSSIFQVNTQRPHWISIGLSSKTMDSPQVSFSNSMLLVQMYQFPSCEFEFAISGFSVASKTLLAGSGQLMWCTLSEFGSSASNLYTLIETCTRSKTFESSTSPWDMARAMRRCLHWSGSALRCAKALPS